MKNEESIDEQKLAIMQQDIEIAKSMNNISHKIAVMSGKGGVGKSTLTVNLAEAFNQKGFKTGVLDADLHGPNVPKMMGITDTGLKIDSKGIVPVETRNGIEIISTEFLLPAHDSPIIWRGPKKTATIRQFLSEVNWGNLDLLLVDNPPGTGDEPLTILQSIPGLDGVIIVTTPQGVALEDVEKCISMVKKLNIPVLGVIENMSGFICPNCHEEINIFGKGGGKQIAERYDIPFLGSLLLDINMHKASEEGISLINKNPDFKIVKKLLNIANKIEKDVFNQGDE